MKVKIQANESGVTLTPVKRYGRGRYVGTAIISNAQIEDGVCTGELVGEYLETYSLDSVEIPNSVKGRMRPLTKTVKSAKVVYATAEKILYLP